MSEWLSVDRLSLVFDVVLVASIFVLWGLWFQQSKQRKNVEHMLLQAAKDLQAATTLLDQVMVQLPKQQLEGLAQAKKVDSAPVKSSLTAREQAYIQRNIQQLQTPKLKQKIAKKPKQEDNIAAKIMRLHREGLDIKGIAKRLSLPIAQVRLMLLLQTSKA